VSNIQVQDLVQLKLSQLNVVSGDESRHVSAVSN
jgi:hypothetical protein